MKVFLEGVEIPARLMGAALSVAPNQPTQFQILLPPVEFEIVKKIRPRTHVAVFFRTGSDGVERAVDWKLFAEGEYLGYGFTKSAGGSMSTVLNFAGLENYWQTIYALHFQTAKSAASTAYSDATLVFGLSGKVMQVDGDANPIPITEVLAKQLGVTETTVPEFFVKLLSGVNALNPFLEVADKRLRLNDRVVAVKDDDIQKLVTVNNLANLITSCFAQHQQDSRLLDILSSLMAMVYYGYQVIPFPQATGKKMHTIWLKPDVPFIAPPRCNVIFAGSMESFSFGRNYLSEPTRLRLTLPILANEGADVLNRLNYYAPSELASFAEKIRLDQEAKKNFEAILNDQPSTRDESREDIKGVIPMVTSLPQFESITLGGATSEARDKYYGGLAEYELMLAQHATRTMRISGRFMPNLVPGLPGIVVMQHGILIGTIENLAHQVSAEGSPSTVISLGYCREADLSGLQGHVWKNTAFTDRSKVDATFEGLLGVKSILAPSAEPGAASGVQFKDQMKAAEAIRDAYQASPDKDAFERRFTTRPIATEEDVFGFLGATKNGRDYTGPNLRKDWVAGVRIFANALQSQIQDAT